MSREIPSLHELTLRVIARYPAKCMTEKKCILFLQHKDKAFGENDIEKDEKKEKKNGDIVQKITDEIIKAGRMTDDAVAPILYQNRKKICLANSKLSAKYMIKVAELCGILLEELDLSGCFQIDDTRLETLLNICPNLIKLYIRNCRKLGDESLKTLTKYQSNKLSPSSSTTTSTINSNTLNTLDIGGNFNMTTEGLELFIQNYKNLKNLISLSLSGLPVSVTLIKNLISKNNKISSLYLSYLDVNEETLELLLKHYGKNLIHLDLSWLSSTCFIKFSPPNSSYFVSLIVNYCPILKELNLTANKFLLKNNIIELIEGRNNMMLNNPDYKQLEKLHIKFIGSPKSTLENDIVNVYTYIKFVI